MRVITVESLAFAHQRSVPMFRDLSLRLEAGHVYGLLGKNGVGKTTLLKLISGLRLPLAGSCTISGNPTHKRLPSMLADLQYVPDDVYLPPLTAHTWLRCYAPFYPRCSETRHAELCKSLELEPRQLLGRLSHGQKKKFLLAFKSNKKAQSNYKFILF